MEFVEKDVGVAWSDLVGTLVYTDARLERLAAAMTTAADPLFFG